MDGPFPMNDHYGDYRGVLWQTLLQLTMSVSPAGKFKKRAFNMVEPDSQGQRLR